MWLSCYFAISIIYRVVLNQRQKRQCEIVIMYMDEGLNYSKHLKKS